MSEGRCARCTTTPAPALLLVSGDDFVCSGCGARHRRELDPQGRSRFAWVDRPRLVTVRLVRCPRCGSTNAGADESRSMYDITCMACADCGHSELVDSWQISFDWNVNLELPEGTGVPPQVPPLDPTRSLFPPKHPLPDVWPTVPRPQRAAVCEALQRLAQARAEAAAATAGGVHGPVTVEVLGATRAGEDLDVSFVTDHFLWNPAQSGSDWFDHGLHFGTVRFIEGQPREPTWGAHHAFTVSEHDEPRYDRARVRAEVVAKERLAP